MQGAQYPLPGHGLPGPTLVAGLGEGLIVELVTWSLPMVYGHA